MKSINGATYKSKLLHFISSVALLCSCSGVAIADTVGFTATNPDPVGIGEAFTISIVGTGFTELSGGVIDLGFDSTHVQIDNVVVDPYFDFFPDGGGPAAGDTWPGIGFDVFGNDPATGDFTIATITATVLTAGISNLTILGTSEFFSTTALLSPVLDVGTISSVPVPAAIWLFGSGLLGLIGIARKKAV
jgi:hypothetical protein